jgi:hypothetical protein
MKIRHERRVDSALPSALAGSPPGPADRPNRKKMQSLASFHRSRIGEWKRYDIDESETPTAKDNTSPVKQQPRRNCVALAARC